MSRMEVEAGRGAPPLSGVPSARLLTTATDLARRAQSTLEGMGSASSVLALTTLGAGMVATLLWRFSADKERRTSLQ